MENRLGAWLARQCELVPGAAQGLVLLADPGGGPKKSLAVWGSESSPSAELVAAAETALSSRRPAVHAAAAAGPDAFDVMALPLPQLGAKSQAAAVAVAVPHGSQAERTRVLRFLQIGAAWLPLVVPPAAASDDDAEATLDLIGLCLAHEESQAGASAVATQLAVRLRCERVAVGFLEGRSVRIRAFSHSAHFEERATLVRDVAAAMEEAIDQEVILVHPPRDPSWLALTRAHAALCSAHGASVACTVPFCERDRVIGAFTLEWGGDLLPVQRDVAWVERVATLAGPLLAARRREEQPLVRRTWELLRRRAGRHFGRDKSGARLAAGAAVAVLLLLAVVPGTYRVSSPARLEGTVQRAIVASIDGYIAETGARAGDVVAAGQVLAQLDGADLTLERRKWQGRRAQLTQEYRAALALHDRTEVSVLRARLAQTQAEIELLDEQLARTQLVAPFDGVIARGDLAQRLGSPVERGEVLFELAPLDHYRIVLEVDEREIGDVEVGQRGELTLAALPGDSLGLHVERIIPVAIAEEGRNFFPVEAQLEAPAVRLRPGMEGVGKIEVGRRSLLWIWTHRVADFVRLALWSWLP